MVVMLVSLTIISQAQINGINFENATKFNRDKDPKMGELIKFGGYAYSVFYQNSEYGVHDVMTVMDLILEKNKLKAKDYYIDNSFIEYGLDTHKDLCMSINKGQSKLDMVYHINGWSITIIASDEINFIGFSKLKEKKI